MVASKIKADHSFFWTKLFSFSGIFPVGAFLAEHFWANSYALVSIDKYDETSRGLQQIPWRVPIEFLFIWLPILFHGGYGVYVWWRGKSNLVQYPWMGNWMYSVQRWTGIMAFAFIGWHVWTKRFLTQGKSDFAEVQHNLQNRRGLNQLWAHDSIVVRAHVSAAGARGGKALRRSVRSLTPARIESSSNCHLLVYDNRNKRSEFLLRRKVEFLAQNRI